MFRALQRPITVASWSVAARIQTRPGSTPTALFGRHQEPQTWFTPAHVALKRTACAEFEEGHIETITHQHRQRGRKRRLDDVCMELNPQYSKNIIQSFIAQGLVHVNGHPVLKAGAGIDPAKVTVELLADPPKYVCRGGLKLEAALKHFGIGVSGRNALDAGLSTGGFADCLLQAGANHVVGVDVGYGQVAHRIRTNPAVTVLERTNLRHLRRSALAPEVLPIQLITLDLSFISVTKVVDAVADILEPGGDLVILIKPQFEAGKAQVGVGGLVRDAGVHAQVIDLVTQAYKGRGFAPRGCTPSPIKGATAGNTEFLAHFVFQPPTWPITDEV